MNSMHLKPLSYNRTLMPSPYVPIQNPPQTITFKPKSQSFPPLHLYLSISAFTKQVTSELSQLNVPFTNTSNLNKVLRKALRSLVQTNSQINMNPADKGGNIVILDREQ